VVAVLSLGLLWWAAAVSAQRSDDAPPNAAAVTEPDAAAQQQTSAPENVAAPERVVIVREPLRLTDASEYRIPLELEPIRTVELAAPVDGVVLSVHVQGGQSIGKQGEAVRMDTTEQQLLLDRATALYKAAQIEAKRAGAAGDRDLIDLADAKLQAAKAEFELAQYRLERMSVRAPFDGQILRVSAVDGQMVRAGEPLSTLVDTTRFKVEIPVDRQSAAAGGPIQIDIEDTRVSATIEQVLPLSERFEKLRDIVTSVASAIVLVDNVGDRLKVGQTVHAPLVPRQPVAEIPNSSLANQGDGTQKVQVIRGNVVRDVKVELLGQVGAERVHISGPLIEGDELIVNTSQPLADGTQVKQATIAAAADTPTQRSGDSSRTKTPRPPQRKTGF
jgi:RND family efflux transporter MFP subunit